MSVTRFSEAIGYVPDLNGCRKKIIEHCRDWESAVYRLEQENEQLIQTSHNTNKELRNKVDRLEQENAELREALHSLIENSDCQTMEAHGYYYTAYILDENDINKAKQLLNK